MRGLGRVKVLQKPLDLMKKVLPRSRRQRSQEQTPAVAAAEPGDAAVASTASLDYHAPTHDAEAEPEVTTTTTTMTVMPAAPRKTDFKMLTAIFLSPSTAAKPAASEKAADPPEECPICQDPVGLANPEGVVEAWTSLRCGHRFGTECIQTWLQETLDRDQNSTPSCPVCRATAKHPDCGHAVCPPSAHNHIWAQYQLRLQMAQNQERERLASGRPQRRRLQRRSGHPRIPTPPRREAEKVGSCTICKAHEARLKQHQLLAQQTDPAAVAATSSATGYRASRPLLVGAATQRIKSYLPVQVSVQSTNGSGSEPVSPVMNHEERASRVQSVFCDTRGLTAAPRHPTLVPEPSYVSQRRESV